MDKEPKNILMFSGVEPRIISALFKKSLIYTHCHSKGKTVYNRHDTCNTLDIIQTGSLIAHSLSENGSYSTVFEFRKHDILGANLLLSETPSYPFNIYCQSDCEILHITRDAVLELLRDYNFVMHYIRSLSRNALGLNQKITMLTQKSLRENIMGYLRELSLLQQSATIILPISKKELADFLGVQRPSLFRALKKLNDEYVLKIEGKKITIL